ncbi:hypothetical protein ABZ719_37570 [Streptomyces sp. NPDC006743]|uniref:hypothetical protein n=2 Tax=unclassified Streptomyces TaxID=2593676 RepID=UPI0005693A3F|nr:hypothetical protein [Streptomyces sp. NRRL S-340]
MRERMPTGAMVSPVEITSASVQRGDLIQIGGRQCLVIDLIQLRQGAKQLVFESGELLTMHSRSRMIAMRMLRRW